MRLEEAMLRARIANCSFSVTISERQREERQDKLASIEANAQESAGLSENLSNMQAT